MKIMVFGATGGTGKLIVELALTEGNQVIAYCRNPCTIKINNERLTKIQGELDDFDKIENAIKGVDAVVSVLGPKGGSKKHPLTLGMQKIITGMKKQGVRRLIVSSTLSDKDPRNLPEFRASVLVSLVRIVMRSAYDDIVGVANLVRTSDLDWTIVRI